MFTSLGLNYTHNIRVAINHLPDIPPRQLLAMELIL